MGQMVRFEITKLLKKKIVYIALAVFGLIYLMMLQSWIFGNEWAVTQDGTDLYGTDAAAYNREITLRYQGPLTDEKVQEILQEFPRINGTTTDHVSNNVYFPVSNLFANEDGTWNGKSVAEVFPEFQEPPRLGMSTRWESFLYSLMYIVMLAGIVLIIVVSPIFSDEYSSGMDALILTSRNGKRQCVKAKIMAAFLFTTSFIILILGLGFSMFLVGGGTAGWDADIQLSEMMVFSKVKQPLTCARTAFLTVAVSICSIWTLTGLVLMFSVVSRTSFTSIIASAVVYLAPMFINPDGLMAKRIIMIMPANSLNISGLMNVKGFPLGQRELPMILAIAGLVIVTVLFSTYYCRRTFSRHQVV